MSISRRVWNNPEIIDNLEHDFTFASDADINERLLLRYRNYDFLTHNDNANTYMLEDVVKTWHDYIENLYATTQYEYDPLLNYDMREEGEIIDELHKGTKRSRNVSLKDATAVDIKDATNVDIKDALNVNRKTATASDTKDATATSTTRTLTPRVERVEEKTGYGLGSDANGTPVEKVTQVAPTGTDQEAVNGTAQNNYTQHTGAAANNYVEETGTAADNYTQRSGTAANNYTEKTGSAANNYVERTGSAANNYETETDIDANTFDHNVRKFDEYRRYGNLGITKPQDMIEAQRRIIIDVIDIYIDKFKDCFNISREMFREPFEEE